MANEQAFGREVSGLKKHFRRLINSIFNKEWAELKKYPWGMVIKPCLMNLIQ